MSIDSILLSLIDYNHLTILGTITILPLCQRTHSAWTTAGSITLFFREIAGSSEPVQSGAAEGLRQMRTGKIYMI